MKKWNFYSNAFYLFIYFFIRFTYFNTVAQTFYILINSQEVSRKSRVSCTSILNLFFFPQCTVLCLLSILHGPFFHVSFSIVCIYCTKREPNVFIWIYYFCSTYFNLSQYYTYRYIIFFNLYTTCTCAWNIKQNS